MNYILIFFSILTKGEWRHIPCSTVPSVELIADSIAEFLIMLITEIDPSLPIGGRDILVEFILWVESIELTVSYARSIVSCGELFPERFFLYHQDKVYIFPVFPGVRHGIILFPVPVYFFTIIEWIYQDTIISTQYWWWRGVCREIECSWLVIVHEVYLGHIL